MDINEQLERGKETIAFRVSNQCTVKSETGRILLDLVSVDCDEIKRNDFSGFYDDCFGHNRFAGLKVTCLMDRQSERPHSWSLCMGDYLGLDDLTLEKAEEIVGILRSIDDKMKEIDEAEGYAESFEEFILRLVRVLNVKAFYVQCGSYLQYKRNDNIGALRDYLRSIIAKNQIALGTAKVA